MKRLGVPLLAMVISLVLPACGGSSTSDGSGGGASGSGGSAASSASGGSSATSGTSGVGGGPIQCTSLIPCCDASGNAVDPICDSSGMPQCPSGSSFPPSGTCSSATCTPTSPCSAAEYCDYPDDLCGTGQPGSCKPRPQGCDLIYDPVCTCAGDEAGNECSAHSSGQDVSNGPCGPQPASFACGTIYCEKGTQYCVHEISDVGGVPDSFTCGTFPPQCISPTPCQCLAGAPCGAFCKMDVEGNATLTCPGG